MLKHLLLVFGSNILNHKSFTFASQNGQTSESKGKKYANCSLGKFSTNAMLTVVRFFQEEKKCNTMVGQLNCASNVFINEGSTCDQEKTVLDTEVYDFW